MRHCKRKLRILNKIRRETPSIIFPLTLRIALKAMTDTMGTNGLVPSYFVFGILPRFPSSNAILPNHEDRMTALKLAKYEMATIFAEQRIRQALNNRTPAATSIVIAPCYRVRVIRESDKRLHGPYNVIRVDGKEVYVEIDNHLRNFNVSQVIRERNINGETQLNEWK